MNIIIEQGFWLFGLNGVIIIVLSKKLISPVYVLLRCTGMVLMVFFEITRDSEIGGAGVHPFWRSTTLVVRFLKKFSTQKYNLLCIDIGFSMCYYFSSQMGIFVRNLGKLGTKNEK